MTRKKKIKNANGLTSDEWIGRVGIVPMLDIPKLYAAWKRGDDPAAWRASYLDKLDGKVKP